MTYQEYLAYLREIRAGVYKDSDQFLAEYGYPASCPWSPENLKKVVDILFWVAEGDITSVIDATARSARAFALMYGVGERAIQRYVKGDANTPQRSADLLGYAVIGDIEKLPPEEMML